jgi:hypothetical protein
LNSPQTQNNTKENNYIRLKKNHKLKLKHSLNSFNKRKVSIVIYNKNISPIKIKKNDSEIYKKLTEMNELYKNNKNTNIKNSMLTSNNENLKTSINFFPLKYISGSKLFNSYISNSNQLNNNHYIYNYTNNSNDNKMNTHNNIKERIKGFYREIKSRGYLSFLPNIENNRFFTRKFNKKYITAEKIKKSYKFITSKTES